MLRGLQALHSPLSVSSSPWLLSNGAPGPAPMLVRGPSEVVAGHRPSFLETPLEASPHGSVTETAHAWLWDLWHELWFLLPRWGWLGIVSDTQVPPRDCHHSLSRGRSDPCDEALILSYPRCFCVLAEPWPLPPERPSLFSEIIPLPCPHDLCEPQSQPPALLLP